MDESLTANSILPSLAEILRELSQSGYSLPAFPPSRKIMYLTRFEQLERGSAPAALSWSSRPWLACYWI